MSATRKNEKQEPLVKLRVIAQKYQEQVSKGGKVKLATVPWNNQVKYKGEIYGPGSVFMAPRSIYEQMKEAGTVQLASEKPKIMRPAMLDHNIILSDGIKLREDVEGKVPTRNLNQDASHDEWEDEDEDFDDEDN